MLSKKSSLPPEKEYQIRYLNDVSKILQIGEQVMPSTHRGQQVCFATYTPNWM